MLRARRFSTDPAASSTGFDAGPYDPGMNDDGPEIGWPACPSCLTLLTMSERLRCTGCGLVVL